MWVDFDRRLKLKFYGSKITSDARLLGYRKLDEVLVLTDLVGLALSNLRRGKNTRHLLMGLMRQSVSRVANHLAQPSSEGLRFTVTAARRQLGPDSLVGAGPPKPGESPFVEAKFSSRFRT